MTEEEKKAIEIIKKEITKPETTPLEVYVTDIKMLLHIIDNQQKELEELKKENIELSNQITDGFWENDRLKNEIEKQQKEIKELSEKLTEKICKGVEEEILEEYRQTIISKDKEIEELTGKVNRLNEEKEQYKAMGTNTFVNSFMGSNYISKDKIRNLLKQVNASLYHFKDSDKNNIMQRVKDRLEKILEE